MIRLTRLPVRWLQKLVTSNQWLWQCANTATNYVKDKTVSNTLMWLTFSILLYGWLISKRQQLLYTFWPWHRKQCERNTCSHHHTQPVAVSRQQPNANQGGSYVMGVWTDKTVAVELMRVHVTFCASLSFPCSYFGKCRHNTVWKKHKSVAFNCLWLRSFLSLLYGWRRHVTGIGCHSS